MLGPHSATDAEQDKLGGDTEVVAHSHLGFHPDEIGLVFKAPRIHDAETPGQVAGGGPEVEVGMVGGVGWNHVKGAQFLDAPSSCSGSRHPAWRCCRSATGVGDEGGVIAVRDRWSGGVLSGGVFGAFEVAHKVVAP